MNHLPNSLSGYRGLRGDLLVALKKAPQALTAKELAEQFGLTPNALRRHLKSLEEQQLVHYRREVRGVGGPVFAYALTRAGEALFPQAYASALTAVLETVRAQQGTEGVAALFRRQWDSLVEEARPQLAALPLAERAQLVAELRTSQGYMAEAVAVSPDEAVIREHHCAIRATAESFPEVCAAEQELLEQLLGVAVQRTEHILNGCHACEYVARAPRPADGDVSGDVGGSITTTDTTGGVQPDAAQPDVQHGAHPQIHMETA
jgi:DeoR family transcriptional regulator, suf operon transcriptional repressor